MTLQQTIIRSIKEDRVACTHFKGTKRELMQAIAHIETRKSISSRRCKDGSVDVWATDAKGKVAWRIIAKLV